MHFERRTIENTALPATWLRQVDPQPQNRREHVCIFSSSKRTTGYPFHIASMMKRVNITLFVENYFDNNNRKIG